MNLCEHCGYECSEFLPACEHCGRPSKFMNVAWANKLEETSVIDSNYDVEMNSVTPEVRAILSNFETIVNGESKAILVRPLAEVNNLFDSLNNFHQTFHERLRAGATHFDGGKYDVNRSVVDEKLFPSYSEKITFASLGLTEIGSSGKYGKCHMLLKTNMINHRASVFKGNSYEILEFLGTKLTKPVPTGWRTTWGRRGKLAVSKLASKFTSSTTVTEFPTLLNDGNNSFIEVHILGRISYRTIESVSVVLSSLNKRDKHNAESLKMRIAEWEGNVPNWDTTFIEV